MQQREKVHVHMYMLPVLHVQCTMHIQIYMYMYMYKHMVHCIYTYMYGGSICTGELSVGSGKQREARSLHTYYWHSHYAEPNMEVGGTAVICIMTLPRTCVHVHVGNASTGSHTCTVEDLNMAVMMSLINIAIEQSSHTCTAS